MKFGALIPAEHEPLDEVFAIPESWFLYVGGVSDIQIWYALCECDILQILLSAPLWLSPKLTSFQWASATHQSAI